MEWDPAQFDSHVQCDSRVVLPYPPGAVTAPVLIAVGTGLAIGVGTLPPRQVVVQQVMTSSPGARTGGSRLWLPGLRLAFPKCHLAAQTWWAQLGSNQ